MKWNSRLTRYKTPLERLFCLRKFQVHSSLLSFCSSQNITQGATNNLPGWLLRLRLHWRYGSAKVSWAWSLQVTQSNSAVGKRPMPPMPPIFFQKKTSWNLWSTQNEDSKWKCFHYMKTPTFCYPSRHDGTRYKNCVKPMATWNNRFMFSFGKCWPGTHEASWTTEHLESTNCSNCQSLNVGTDTCCKLL